MQELLSQRERSLSQPTSPFGFAPPAPSVHLVQENVTVQQAQEMGYLLYRTIFWYCDFIMVIIKTF
jgi:hypothetical protein